VKLYSTLSLARTGCHKKTGTFEMRRGSHVQLAALRNRDLKLNTTSTFSNHGSVERSTVCCRHKNVLHVWISSKYPFFFVSFCTSRCASVVLRGHIISSTKPNNNHLFSSIFSLIQALILQTPTERLSSDLLRTLGRPKVP
jgi:hypothetical protein